MSSTTQPPKPKRRWCQFSLKTEGAEKLQMWMLLAGSFLVSGLVGCVDQEEPLDGKVAANKQLPAIEKTVSEEQAIVEIRKLGGSVTVSGTVVSVQFYGPDVTDAGLEQLKGLKSPLILTLIGTKVTDARLEHLRELEGLRDLGLHRTKVTDAGLEHLKGLKSLLALNLVDTRVTDAGLEHLKGLTNLEQLDLSETQVSDAGVERLKQMRSLQYLVIWHTQVTDEGVEKLQQALPNCKIIRK